MVARGRVGAGTGLQLPRSRFCGSAGLPAPQGESSLEERGLSFHKDLTPPPCFLMDRLGRGQQKEAALRAWVGNTGLCTPWLAPGGLSACLPP